jgi:hypothetical protein
MWKQLRDCNWRIQYVGGWCLKFVQDAFGTDHVYPDAMSAWNANVGGGNHVSQPPVGKTVPVYFSLGNVPQGHIAICMDDGKVASSTQAGTHPQAYIHPNLNDLIAVYGKYNGGCAYLGWSEYVGTVHVIEWDNPNATADQVRQDYLDILERPADDGGLAHYQNYTNDFVRADLMNSAEYKQLQSNKAIAAQAVIDEANKEAAAKAAADAIAAKTAADAKAEADAKAALPPVVPVIAPVDPNADNNAFTSWLKNIFEIIAKFLTSWRK